MDETRDAGFASMDKTRDTELGEQLEAFGEPEHGSDYWRDVRQAVAEARAEAAAEARRPGVGRRLRAALAPRRVRLTFAAAALAVVAAAVLLVGLPGAPGPQPVSAAEVLRRALAVPASIRTWQADMRLEWYDKFRWKKYHANLVRRAHFMRDVAGGARETYSAITAAGHRLEPPYEEVYDPATDDPLPYYDSEIGCWVAATNGPIGGPDAGTIPLIDIGLAVRALAASSTLRLDETMADGRPAWTVTCTKGEMAGLPSVGDDATVYTVVVDKQTWNLLRVKEVKKGRVTFDLRYRNVRINEPLPKNAFHVEPPPGARVKRVDGGFRRVTLAQAAAVPGATVLVPRSVPAGYELSQVTVADRAKLLVWVASEKRDRSIRGRHVVTLVYRRGFDGVSISTRAVGRAYSVDIDPCEGFDQAWSQRAHREVAITSGAFAGATARIVAASTSAPPHLWAMKDGVLLTVAGAATADELLAIAESLEAYPASPSPAQ